MALEVSGNARTTHPWRTETSRTSVISVGRGIRTGQGLATTTPTPTWLRRRGRSTLSATPCLSTGKTTINSFTKNWPGSPRHRGNTQVGAPPSSPTSAVVFDWHASPVLCPPLPAVFQPRKHQMALSSPMATVTFAWGAPRRLDVLRTSSPVRTAGDQDIPRVYSSR
ncbi:neuronal d4 domain family member, isoform CRA_c [Rattus norvegicus]|uniref:Neuronal d4 domain family member, isoform CRA_c n=1 Tax=Rattus norvegicus TaxID=10116 RepID=A6J9Q8_RAT|nr:neuronal d4 domain family member, isoform CRA_c [Rattus norvegicus]